MNQAKKDQSKLEVTAQTEVEAAAEESNETLDFDQLDLTVEAVDERISPSETNVFDK